MRRVVVDTNIMVSAYLGGALEAVIVAWKAGKFTLIVSDQISSEYFRILKRPKFQIELDELEDFAALILSNAEFVLPEEHVLVIQADPSDNKFIEVAIAGKADYIVSGDKHLLDIKEYQSIPIITARIFIEMLETP